MQSIKAHRVVFLIPVLVLCFGLLAVFISTDRAHQAREQNLREQFESDAAIRFLIIDGLAERLQVHLRNFSVALSTQAASGFDRRLELAGNVLTGSYGSDPAAGVVHFYVARTDSRGRFILVYSHPRAELIGTDISDHLVLRDFDYGRSGGLIDQISYRASRENDLSFTSDSPVFIRRHLLSEFGVQRPLVGIVKLNLVDLQRHVDSQLRVLGPLPEVDLMHYAPDTGECLLRYRAGEGQLPCTVDAADINLAFSSERNGISSVVRATDDYVEAYERLHPTFAYPEMLVTLLGSAVALLISVVLRNRFTTTQDELEVYRGSLDRKDEMAEVIHSVVADKLSQLVDLAKQVKRASETGAEQSRYLSIALSEIGQARLSLDAKFAENRGLSPADLPNVQRSKVHVKQLANGIQEELERLTSDEGVESRMFLDDSLAHEIDGSFYWLESALLAFINASHTFNDEGFLELYLWTEIAPQGQCELWARIRDTGIPWSLEATSSQHPSLEILRSVLSVVGGELKSSEPLAAGGQEHVIRFPSA